MSDQEGSARKRNPILSRAIAHYARDDLREVIAIQEWGDEEGVPLRVFAFPMSVKEKQELMDDQNRAGLLLAGVNLILRKACDEKGEKLFHLHDRRELQMAVSPIVVEKIAAAILATEYAAAEDLAKK